MSDTMISMELVLADTLFADQLMEGDFIKIEDDFGYELVQVKNVIPTDEGYIVESVNDYGEEIETLFADNDLIKLYVYVE